VFPVIKACLEQPLAYASGARHPIRCSDRGGHQVSACDRPAQQGGEQPAAPCVNRGVDQHLVEVAALAPAPAPDALPTVPPGAALRSCPRRRRTAPRPGTPALQPGTPAPRGRPRIPPTLAAPRHAAACSQGCPPARRTPPDPPPNTLAPAPWSAGAMRGDRRRSRPITAYLGADHVGCDVLTGHNTPPDGELTDNQKGPQILSKLHSGTL
jgi:hypothetical protein